MHAHPCTLRHFTNKSGELGVHKSERVSKCTEAIRSIGEKAKQLPSVERNTLTF